MLYPGTRKYKLNSDEELMLFIIKGNEKALEELYTRYSKPMLYFFYQRLDHDEQKAQDFLQDLFLKVIEKSYRYDTGKKFKVWLYSVAANMCKNEYRKAGIRGVKADDFDFNTVPEDLPDLLFQHKFDRCSFTEALTTELEKLEEDHSLTFTLRYYEHLSIKEISEIMGCPEGTVKSRLFYAIKKLAQQLSGFNPYKEIK